MPNVVKNLVDNLKSVPYDKKRAVHGAVAVGRGRARLQPEEDRARAELDQRPLRPGVQGPRDDALRALRLGRHRCCSAWASTRRTAKIDQILAAIDKIDKAADAGQFRRFTGNDYSTDLTKGNIWVALAYSGDIVQLQSDNPDLKFVYPDEGAMLFTDNMMIPAKAEHIYAAETMMNFVYEPEIAAKLAIYVNYLSPVKGVKEIVEKTDPKHRQQPADLPARRDPRRSCTPTRRSRTPTSAR